MWGRIPEKYIHCTVTLLAVSIFCSSPGSFEKWSWGPRDSSSLPDNFRNSRLPHAPPTFPERTPLNSQPGTNFEIKSKDPCNNNECPSITSKGDTRSLLSGAFPLNNAPSTLVQHHHIHTHLNEGILGDGIGAASIHPIVSSDQAFPQPVLPGNQQGFPSQAMQFPLANNQQVPFAPLGLNVPGQQPSSEAQPTIPIGAQQQSQFNNIPSAFPGQLPSQLTPGGNQEISSFGQISLTPQIQQTLPIPGQGISIQPVQPNLPPNYLNDFLEPCQCVHPTLCDARDIVSRSAPLLTMPMIDPRSRLTEIISNTSTTTDESSKDEVNSRSTRNANPKDIQGRNMFGRNHLIGGYTPTQEGCQLTHVCCRDPFLKTLKQQFSCGIGNTRGAVGRSTLPKLVKGEAEFGEHPWQAALLKEDKGESVYLCGAALVTSRHLLTAAHCVNSLHASSLTVRLGEWDVSGDVEFFKHLDIGVESVRSHPQYYAGNLMNDIAVLTLKTPVDFENNPHISPVCLPEGKQSFVGQQCYSTGWGKDAFGGDGKYQHILKEVKVPIVDHRMCQSALRSTRLGASFTLFKGMMCAGGEIAQDTCTGDGGGPLVCLEKDGTAYLAGLVSWGIGCGQPGIPGVYVDVPYYMDWILSYLRF